MASDESKACIICMNDFDTTDRQTVALPCGHSFCLTCLVCLKASNSPVCPQCRQSFPEVKLPDSSSITILGPINRFVGCEVHHEAFVFWSNSNKEFYCTQCIVTLDLKTCDLQLISDAVPLIRKDLQTKVRAVSRALTSDLSEHKRERKEAVQELEKIKKFQEELQKQKMDFEDFVRSVDYHRFMRLNEFDSATKIGDEIEKIKSADDIASMLEFRRTLEELLISSQVPRKTRPATFLSEVACTYAEDGGQKVSFIKKLQKRKNYPAKPTRRSDGNLTKIEAFILRCFEIRRLVFMVFFKRAHRNSIQQ